MKTVNKKVSIIVPIYNADKFLSQCLDSIINQTYKYIEIILVNDGSTDNSLNICHSYMKKDSRIILINKDNEGVSSARNNGVKKATGEYITFVDADDYLELMAIEIMINIALKNRVDIVKTNTLVNGNPNLVLPEFLMLYNDKNKNKNKLIDAILDSSIPAFVPTFLIKKDLIIKNNVFFNKNLVMMEDTVFIIELLMHNTTVILTNDLTYNYRLHDNSSSNSLDRSFDNIKSIIYVNNEFRKMIKDKDLMITANTTEYSIITDYIFKMYKANIDKNIINNILNYLSNDTNFNKMITNIDKNRLNKYALKALKYFYKGNPYKIKNCYKWIVRDNKIDDINGIIDYKLNRIYNKYIKRFRKI